MLRQCCRSCKLYDRADQMLVCSDHMITVCKSAQVGVMLNRPSAVHLVTLWGGCGALSPTKNSQAVGSPGVLKKTVSICKHLKRI